MCIAIAKPGTVIISKETLERCFEVNSDGAGYMFPVKNGPLVVKKGFFTFEDFWNEYKKDQSRRCAIHFRIKTHGAKDEENCHPFLVNENLGFIHNGIISNVETKDDHTKSDSWHFNEIVLKELPEDFLSNHAVKELISFFVGWSKLVFLNSKGNFNIINQERGTWDDKVWYSNDSFKIPKQYNFYNKKNSKWDRQHPPYTPQLSNQPSVNKDVIKPYNDRNFSIGCKVKSRISGRIYTIESFGDGLQAYCRGVENPKDYYEVPLYNLDIYIEEKKQTSSDEPSRSVAIKIPVFNVGAVLEVIPPRWPNSIFKEKDMVEVVADNGNGYVCVKSVWDDTAASIWEPKYQFKEIMFPTVN